MILDKIFIHLRKTGTTGKFLASHVLNWYGKLFIGAPKPEDIPGPDDDVKRRISDTYFNISTERMPLKRNANWEISQLWTAQLRDEEEKQVGIAAYIYPIVICTLLMAAGGAVHKATTNPDGWWQQRQAKSAAEKAAKYEAQREDNIQQWTVQAQSYSAQKCLDETSKLRVRHEREDHDRYSAIEKGCRENAEEISQIGQTMNLSKCEAFGRHLFEDLEGRNGSMTWADDLAWRGGCMSRFGTELRASLEPFINQIRARAN
ncbi:hypothetical protein [Luteimonas sp. MC1750]|uniref:hypothetical protein n=1 Tax=Luteimonas sp. MC1750 TaxID=2799326 RepID=UPI0018F0EC56|nr:hypothetical protein [Luteimonas sp. MC1750]MBJ6984035.1 hypothetical protein [Luteimonas sp. MC1750]QQO06847.1 hypothetical protein JGR68_05315 [Luteimonas sp. MC1750]